MAESKGFKLNLNHASEFKTLSSSQLKDKDFNETILALDVQKDVALTKLHNTKRVEHISDLT